MTSGHRPCAGKGCSTVTGFLTELGKKLAERWLTLLVLPGALYLAVALVAHVEGHRHPFDLSRPGQWVSEWVSKPAVAPPGELVVALLAFLLASAAVGTAVQGTAGVIERLWFAEDHQRWPRPLRDLADAQLRRRRAQWNTQHAKYRAAVNERAQAVAQARADEMAEPRAQAMADNRPAGRDDEQRRTWNALTRVAIHKPARLTWVGDRIYAVTRQLDDEYRLDAATVWPALWLTMSSTAREEIARSRELIARAAALCAWGLAYLALGVLSWPVVFVGLILVVTGWARSRRCAEDYARLLESAFRLHGGDTARALGIAHRGVMNAQTGWALTLLLQGRADRVEATTGWPQAPPA